MRRNEPSNALRHPQRGERLYNAVRATLIGYGVVGFAFLQSQLAPAGPAQALGGFASSQSLLLAGLGLQILLVVARAFLKRYATDDNTVATGVAVSGLVADAVTVLLFALGTFGAIAPAAREL